MSVPYLDGASIDFEDTIQKQGFTIDNPNAQGSCACGDSLPLIGSHSNSRREVAQAASLRRFRRSSAKSALWRARHRRRVHTRPVGRSRLGIDHRASL